MICNQINSFKTERNANLCHCIYWKPWHLGTSQKTDETGVPVGMMSFLLGTFFDAAVQYDRIVLKA